MREQGDNRHVRLAAGGRYGGHDVAVLCHLHVLRTHSVQFLLEHLQQHQLPRRAGTCCARLIGLRINLNVA